MEIDIACTTIADFLKNGVGSIGEKLKYVIIILTIVIIMLTILRPGYAKIMQLFYMDKSAKLHLREIARQTELFEPSAFRFLNSLEKDQILKSEKVGNQKRYSIKRAIRAYFTFEAFDLERFEKLPSIRKSAIKTYLDSLPEQPVFALLFGSTAKGTYNEDSDIDVLLVTNNKIDVRQAEKEVDSLTAIKISTFQISYKDYLTDLKMREDKVIQSAINSGYPLINHVRYYEVLYERA
jgi:predicted nucleotidyltransferase